MTAVPAGAETLGGNVPQVHCSSRVATCCSGWDTRTHHATGEGSRRPHTPGLHRHSPGSFFVSTLCNRCSAYTQAAEEASSASYRRLHNEGSHGRWSWPVVSEEPQSTQQLQRVLQLLLLLWPMLNAPASWLFVFFSSQRTRSLLHERDLGTVRVRIGMLAALHDSRIKYAHMVPIYTCTSCIVPL